MEKYFNEGIVKENLIRCCPVVKDTCFASMSFTIWQPDFETAKQKAKEKHELILLNFSGSDWCGPCMRMRKEIFENEQFYKMADTTLILVNADFPPSHAANFSSTGAVTGGPANSPLKQYTVTVTGNTVRING